VAEAPARKGASGVLNVQCVLNSDGKAYFVETNPRIGSRLSINNLTMVFN
jgi:carbamoylphosphate synthase large subunit